MNAYIFDCQEKSDIVIAPSKVVAKAYYLGYNNRASIDNVDVRLCHAAEQYSTIIHISPTEKHNLSKLLRMDDSNIRIYSSFSTAIEI